jgi:enamine deaminase RidA (YjgF/YER057c/UK114 family)
MQVDERLAELGIELPPAPSPVAAYAPVAIGSGLAFVAGQIAREDGTVLFPGRVGAEVDVEEARQAARRCALQALSALRDALGGFERLERIVKVEVFVASAEDFTGQPAVADGASEVLAEILGDAGVHARAAVGVVALPLGASVEVAMIAAVRS